MKNKTHAPKAAHHAIHVNCVHKNYHASPAIGPARQRRRASMGAKVSEQGAKIRRNILRDYIAFGFAVLISFKQCIDWTI